MKHQELIAPRTRICIPGVLGVVFVFIYWSKESEKRFKTCRTTKNFLFRHFLRYCPPLLSKKSHGIGKAEKKNSLPEVMVEYCMLYMLLFQAHKPLTHSLGLFKNAKITW